jgi:hypothetical protein
MSSRTNTSELLFLGGLAVFAGTTLVVSLGMPFTSGLTFGPGFLPVIMSVAVLALCGLILLRGLAGQHTAAEPGTPVRGDLRTVVLCVALIAATLAALGVCLLLTTSLLLGRGWRVGIISTVITLVAIYAIFDLWLKIPIR